MGKKYPYIDEIFGVYKYLYPTLRDCKDKVWPEAEDSMKSCEKPLQVAWALWKRRFRYPIMHFFSMQFWMLFFWNPELQQRQDQTKSASK